MSSSSFAYEFEFNTDYSEDIFKQCPDSIRTDSLRTQVINAVNTEKSFLQKFTQVNRIAQQVLEGSLRFRVILNR